MTNSHLISPIEFLSHRINGEGIIAACIRTDHLDLLQMLLKTGLSPDEHEDHGMSALSLAVHLGKLPAVAMLLARGASVHGTQFEDSTPITYAIERDDLHVAAILLAHGATPDYRPSSEGRLPREVTQSEGMRALFIKFGFGTERRE